MARTTPESVIAQGMPVREEREANAAIKPGYVLELLSSGKVRKQNAAGQLVGFKVALENAPAGGDINTAYAAKDNVLIATLAPGDKAYVRVAASAAAIAMADFVQTHTDGTVLKGTASNGIGIAQEAVDNSSNSASEAFILVEAF